MKRVIFLLVLVCCSGVGFMSFASEKTEVEKFIESSKFNELFGSPKVPEGFRFLLQVVENGEWEKVSSSDIKSRLTKGTSADHISQDYLNLVAIVLAQKSIIEKQNQILKGLQEVKEAVSEKKEAVAAVVSEEKASLAAKNQALEAENTRLKASAKERQEEILALRDIVRELSMPKEQVVSAEPALDYTEWPQIQRLKAAVNAQSEEIRRATEELSGREETESMPKEEGERVSEAKGPRRVYRVGRIPRREE